MKSGTLEKLLYKAAVLLVIIGALIKFIFIPDSDIGLYLILSGHVVGVACILAYMKQASTRERRAELHHRNNLNQYKNN